MKATVCSDYSFTIAKKKKWWETIGRFDWFSTKVDAHMTKSILEFH